MAEDKYWVSSDTGPNGTVVAISRIESQDKSGVPKGEFLNAVFLKHSLLPSFCTPALKQLVYESHGLFCRAQVQHKQDLLKTNDILSLSLEYRSVIRSALSSIRSFEDETYNLLSSWELIWSLVETIFFKPSTSSIVADLITWARMYLARTDHIDEISSSLRPSKVNGLNKDAFWNQVKFFILGGLFVNASKLLKVYGNLVNDTSVKKLAEILDQLDVSAFCNTDSEGDLSKLRRNLHTMVESGHFKRDSESYQIAMLLLGHLPTLKTMASFCSSWFEILPIYAFLFRPTAQLEDLPELAKECCGFYGSKEENDLDVVVRSICSVDALLAIQHIASVSSDWWLTAHLSDLLQKANSSLMNAYGVDARQHLVMEYGMQLFDEPGMWLIGFDYLIECGIEGRNKLGLLLSSLQIDNEAMALKLISRCAAENFENLVCDLERSVALRYLSTGQWSSALIWGMRTEDSKLLDTIANRILLECTPEVLAKMSVLEELNEVTLLSPALVFLHKYYSFRKLFVSAQKEAAALCLVDLIVSGRAPHRLSSALFNDLAVVLSFDGDRGPLLDKNTVNNMLQYLTRCDVKRTLQRSENDGTEYGDNLDALRLSLLNSLCRSFVL